MSDLANYDDLTGGSNSDTVVFIQWLVKIRLLLAYEQNMFTTDQ